MTAAVIERIDNVFDPLMLVERWPAHYPAFLESSAEAEQTGRFDILPIADGRFIALGADGAVRDECARIVGTSFSAALDALWRAEGGVDAPDMTDNRLPPFQGGWLLYLGYEIAAEYEPSLQLTSFDAFPFPLAFAVRTPAVFVRDRSNGRGWLVCERGFQTLVADFRRDLRAAMNASMLDTPAPPVKQIVEDARSRFIEGVDRILDYIRAGDVFQVNLSRAWSVAFEDKIDPIAIYRRLRKNSPAPFSGLLRWQDAAIVSASPERLLRVRGRCIDTRPIAGTRPRNADASVDAALRSELLAHPKERAEHVMLIDLERNDLGRICVPGSIRVDDLMTLESYSHVHHIVSNVSGTLRDDTTPGSILRALFPGGTITGCPKVRCMEIIAELESTGRGPYTGAIGYLDRSGDMDMNILIRSAWSNGDRLGFRTGAGIVADSVPERELAETRAKAAGWLKTLNSGAVS